MQISDRDGIAQVCVAGKSREGQGLTGRHGGGLALQHEWSAGRSTVMRDAVQKERMKDAPCTQRAARVLFVGPGCASGILLDGLSVRTVYVNTGFS